MKYFVFAVLLWASGISGAEQRFLTTSFSPDLSETSVFTSVLKKIELQNKQYAQISLPATERFVGVVWGQRETGEDGFWVAGMGTSGLILQSGGFKQVGKRYQGEIDLKELGAAEESARVQVQIDTETQTLHYGSLDHAQLGVVIGAPMPNLKVQKLDGTSLSLAQLRGRPVVINWWTTSCSPCIEEMPGLNGLVKKYGDRVAFLSVAWNSPKEVHAFLKRRAFLYEQSVSTPELEQYLGGSFPRNVVIQADGRVVYDSVGGHPNKYRELDGVLTELFSNQ